MKYKVGTVIEFNADGNHCIGEIVETDSGLFKKYYFVRILGKHEGYGHNGFGNTKWKYNKNDYYFVDEEEVLSVVNPEEIHITRKGNEVHAVLKNGGKVIARSKAVCSPEDEFDFYTGANLAFSRLTAQTCEEKKADPEPEYVEIVSKEGVVNGYNVGDVCKVIRNTKDYFKLSSVSDGLIQIVSKTDTKPLKVVKRAAKPGEYIMLVKHGSFSFDDIGNIMKAHKTVGEVTVCFSSGFVVFREKPDKGLWSYFREEYVVLEGYEPTKKFVPHLESIEKGTNYGTIGEETPMKDILGKKLYVGDLVVIVEKETGRITEQKFVVCNDTIRDGKKAFVMGIERKCKKSGEIKGFCAVKQRSYEHLLDGETVGLIKAVLKE